MSWEPEDGAVSYKIDVSANSDCTSPIQTLDNLTETEKEISIPDVGIFYVCLTAISADGTLIEANNSRSKITVEVSTRANLSYGTSNQVAFGERVIGSEVFALVKIVNKGGAAASEVGFTAFDEPIRFRGTQKAAGIYPGIKGDCGASIEPQASCGIWFGFAPTKTADVTVDLKLHFFDGTETQEIQLVASGLGVEPGVLEFGNAVGVNFGTQARGSKTEQTFTLKNSGKSLVLSLTPAALEAPFSYKGGTFPGVGGTCTDTLAAAASCTFLVEYAPTVTGLAVFKLSVNYSDQATSRSVQTDVQGTAQ
jgi:hypothetical protein